MAKCEFCDKGVAFGIRVSHSHRRSNRPWKPNVTEPEAMGGVILIKIFVQYLLTPIPFLLTFVTPILFFLISRKYVWLSIPLTVLVELLVNWRNFTYYESRGLMILVTLFQLAIMAVVIILLRSAFTKKKT